MYIIYTYISGNTPECLVNSHMWIWLIVLIYKYGKRKISNQITVYNVQMTDEQGTGYENADVPLMEIYNFSQHAKL